MPILTDYGEFFPEHPQAKTHYIPVRAHIPWVVSEIVGPLPPRKEDNPFLHALMLMLLFIPWRSIPELLSGCETQDDVVLRYREHRRSWEELVEGLEGRRPADVPSKEAFAYLTLRRIANLKMMSSSATRNR